MAEKKNKALKFFRETKSEMKKVSWPSREHLFRNTAVILAFVIIMTIVLSLVDFGFDRLLSLIVK